MTTFSQYPTMSLSKRYLPFIIIATVAALTVGAGVMLYRAKQRAIPTARTTSMPVDKTISETADKTKETAAHVRSEEHTSELQSRQYLVCRLLLEKKKNKKKNIK